MEYLKRLIYRPDGTRIPLPTHLFFYITLVFGIAFVLPPSIFGLGLVEIFKFSSLHGLAQWWGMALITTTLLNTIMLITRNQTIAQVTGVLGFCCWLYAAIGYFIVGFPFGLLVGAVPNMIFWAWYTFRLSGWSNYINNTRL